MKAYVRGSITTPTVFHNAAIIVLRFAEKSSSTFKHSLAVVPPSAVGASGDAGALVRCELSPLFPRGAKSHTISSTTSAVKVTRA